MLATTAKPFVPPMLRPAVCVPAPAKKPLAIFKLFVTTHIIIGWVEVVEDEELVELLDEQDELVELVDEKVDIELELLDEQVVELLLEEVQLDEVVELLDEQDVVEVLVEVVINSAYSSVVAL